MNTTNPTNPGGGEQPGAGRKWPADAADASAPDDSGGGGGVNPESIRAGHEPDVFAVKPILSVPLAVVVSFVIAFVVAAVAYKMLSGEERDPFTHPDAVAREQEPLNNRLARIERKGLDETNPRREMDQPRLEPLRRLEGNGLFYARPELPTGNSPEIHPEEISPDRVAALQRAGYTDGDKKTARIPIADAMKIAVAGKTLFPVQKVPSNPVSTADRPSTSNAGRSTPPAAPNPPEVPKSAVAPQPKKATPAPPEKK